MQPTQENQARDIKFRRVVTGHTADGQAGIASAMLVSKHLQK